MERIDFETLCSEARNKTVIIASGVWMDQLPYDNVDLSFRPSKNDLEAFERGATRVNAKDKGTMRRIWWKMLSRFTEWVSSPEQLKGFATGDMWQSEPDRKDERTYMIIGDASQPTGWANFGSPYNYNIPTAFGGYGNGSYGNYGNYGAPVGHL